MILERLGIEVHLVRLDGKDPSKMGFDSVYLTTEFAQGALDKAIKYVKQRKQFGHPVGAFQAVQFKIAEMATWIEAARILGYQAGWMIDRGKVDPKLISMAKWLAAEGDVIALVKPQFEVVAVNKLADDKSLFNASLLSRS
jgi:hypothetical protein